jgi:nicotinate phosphoribosyltransferase
VLRGDLGDAVFIIDTYDAVAAARMLPLRAEAEGGSHRQRRSGGAQPRSRRIFDERGLNDTTIVLSGDLDEMRIAEILAAGAPVDGFGVGTAVSTASDAPALSGVYKLAEIEREGRAVPVLKRSPGKRTYPGRKQVWRVMRGGIALEDVLALEDAGATGRRRTAFTSSDEERRAIVSSVAERDA